MSPTRARIPSPSSILRLDRVVETVKVGEKPAGVAVAPGGERIYVSNPAGHSVSVIERAATDAIASIAEIAAGQGPLGIALDLTGKRLFVADWYADQSS